MGLWQDSVPAATELRLIVLLHCQPWVTQLPPYPIWDASGMGSWHQLSGGQGAAGPAPILGTLGVWKGGRAQEWGSMALLQPRCPSRCHIRSLNSKVKWSRVQDGDHRLSDSTVSLFWAWELVQLPWPHAHEAIPGPRETEGLLSEDCWPRGANMGRTQFTMSWLVIWNRWQVNLELVKVACDQTLPLGILYTSGPQPFWHQGLVSWKTILPRAGRWGEQGWFGVY